MENLKSIQTEMRDLIKEANKKQTYGTSLPKVISEILAGTAEHQNQTKANFMVQACTEKIERIIANFNETDELNETEIEFFQFVFNNSTIAQALKTLFLVDNHGIPTGGYIVSMPYLPQEQRQLFLKGNNGELTKDCYLDYHSLQREFVRQLETTSAGQLNSTDIVTKIIASATALSITNNKKDKVRVSTIKTPFLSCKVKYAECCYFDEEDDDGNIKEGEVTVFELESVQVSLDNETWYELNSYGYDSFDTEELLNDKVEEMTGIPREEFEYLY